MWLNLAIDLAIIFLFIGGIALFYRPREARVGNLMAAGAIAGAFVAVLLRNRFEAPYLMAAALAAGSAAGWLVARVVRMIRIPAMVAFQNGAGGLAACLISFVEMTGATAGTAPAVAQISGYLGLVLGAATFSGSMVASGKLSGVLSERTVDLPRHSLLLLLNVLVVAALAVAAEGTGVEGRAPILVAMIGLSLLLGVVFTIRIGGADMPIIISFLNATTGLAAALCGIIVQNRLLVACGAVVAASGSILTHMMCKAINRSLANVFVGIKKAAGQKPADPFSRALQEQAAPRDGAADRPDAGEAEGEAAGAPADPHGAAVAAAAGAEAGAEAAAAAVDAAADNLPRALEAMRRATKVVIIPGYGMAMAQAQFTVVKLARRLEELGKEVRFAIHPVAGRMPGHMNVLLAEADVDYEKLVEMDDINPDFQSVDLALVVGACDVVNPAAIESEGTPISGMPVLLAHEAKSVVVCNLDAKPGYSGVENPLYGMKKTITLFGDAADTVAALLEGL